jgi:Type I phosphodiesterase / nucleotide pyrophosphatase
MLVVCYVPGFDLRYIDDHHTPYTSKLLKSYPYVRIKSYPCTELLPSILTGSYPHDHGKYQISLKTSIDHLESHRPTSRVADFLGTTFQCLYHIFDYRFDLPGIPAWRRRSLDLTTRFKFVVRQRDSNVLRKIGDMSTIFDIVDDSKYHFSMEFKKLDKIIEIIRAKRRQMTFVEIHSLDILQLWYMDQRDKIADYYSHFDQFVKKLHRHCQEDEMTLVLLVDRGMEATHGVIDIMDELRKIDLAPNEYSFFIEPPMARFWFHTDRARSVVTEMLAKIYGGQLFTFEELKQYRVDFQTTKFGELFFIADAGRMIFPHDFYHPIGNIFLGLTDWKQRPRMADPRQRAVHGFLPSAESETGFMVVCDQAHTARTDQAEIIDVAPSLIDLLGCRKPKSMRGRSVFAMRSAVASSTPREIDGG